MERVSAFMDGEVGDDEVAAQVARLRQDPALRERWDTYHLISDAMRSVAGAHAESTGKPDFMERFSATLAQEPTVLAPKTRVRSRTVRRVALSLAASFGGVALVAWLALSNNPFMPAPETVAQARPAPVAIKSADGAVNDYLLAHQQFSPSTAMQGVASYVRTVSGGEADMR